MTALDEGARRDLDESRRLLYMVLMGAMEGERWFSVGGTIVNALAHHSGIVDAEQVMENLWKIRNGGGRADALAWVRAVVARINERLEAD